MNTAYDWLKKIGMDIKNSFSGWYAEAHNGLVWKEKLPSPEDSQKIRFMMDNIIKQADKNDGMSASQARMHVKEGLLEIVCNGRHAANGLLMTHNGYFLTAHHCVEMIGNKSVKCYDGRLFPIERVCMYSPKDDVALVKAAVRGDCSPLEYRFFNGELDNGTPLAFLAQKNGQVFIKNCFVHDWNKERKHLRSKSWKILYNNHFVAEFGSSVAGDSGGVLTTYDGGIVGLMCWAELDEKTKEFTNRNGAVKISRALEIVSFYKQKFEKVC